MIFRISATSVIYRVFFHVSANLDMRILMLSSFTKVKYRMFLFSFNQVLFLFLYFYYLLDFAKLKPQGLGS